MINISIIIPVYNSRKYLHDCLYSIYEEKPFLKNFEVIAVNDGSTDNSLNILKQYAEKYPNIIVINNKKNEGQSVARNTAISKARGEYLMFVDSDDTIEKSSLKKLLKQANVLQTDVIGYNAFIISKKGRKKKRRESSHSFSFHFFLSF